MEFIPVLLVLVAVTQLVLQESQSHSDTGFMSNVVSTHGHNVAVIAGDAAQSGRNALYDSSVNVGALASCDMDTHAGAAENQSTLELALSDLCTDLDADTMEHLGMGIIHVLDTDIGNSPTLFLQNGNNGILQLNSSEVSSNQNLLVLNSFHNAFLLYS